MGKPLLYRLFGIGKISEPLRAQLQNEGIVLMDEAVKGSVTYRDFSAPGKRDLWRRQWYIGAIALTKVRLLTLSGNKPTINVPVADERIHSMRYSVEKNGTVLCIAFDAGLFHADWSGTIEYRLRTQEAQRFVDLLMKQAA
jgi:hypothetical protein